MATLDVNLVQDEAFAAFFAIFGRIHSCQFVTGQSICCISAISERIRLYIYFPFSGHFRELQAAHSQEMKASSLL